MSDWKVCFSTISSAINLIYFPKCTVHQIILHQSDLLSISHITKNVSNVLRMQDTWNNTSSNPLACPIHAGLLQIWTCTRCSTLEQISKICTIISTWIHMNIHNEAFPVSHIQECWENPLLVKWRFLEICQLIKGPTISFCKLQWRDHDRTHRWWELICRILQLYTLVSRHLMISSITSNKTSSQLSNLWPDGNDDGSVESQMTTTWLLVLVK